MILLKRVRKVGKIHKNFFGENRVELNKLLIRQKLAGDLDGNSENKWDSKIWKKAKKQLLSETNNKCAYCETPTRVIAYGDVEHFRPKNIYWWLAYCYENFLAACTVCNQEYKKDLFELLDPQKRLTAPTISDGNIEIIAPLLTPDPISNAGGKDLQEFENELLNERALIVHPYLEDPAEYYAYLPILENKEIVVIPTMPEYQAVIEASERIFGVNRKELMDLRFQWYLFYMTFRRTLNAPNLPEDVRTDNQNRINEMLEDSSPYAGMIRYFNKQPLEQLPWQNNNY